MKRKLLLGLLVILVMHMCITRTAAQLVLVDSFEFGPHTRLMAYKKSPGSTAFSMIRPPRSPGSMPPDSLNEIRVRGKYTITIPSHSEPLYIDNDMLLLQQFIPGNAGAADKTMLSRYAIAADGSLDLVKSVALNTARYSIFYPVDLPEIPVIIARSSSKKVGNCNDGYAIFNRKLKAKKVIVPDLVTCGVNSNVCTEDSKIHFIDQDAADPGMISWCTADAKLKSISRRRIVLTDKNFVFLASSVDHGMLYLSGWGKAQEPPNYYTLVYDSTGAFVERFSTLTATTDGIYRADEKVIYLNRSGKCIQVSNASKYRESKFYLPGEAVLMDRKVLINFENKVMQFRID